MEPLTVLAVVVVAAVVLAALRIILGDSRTR